jgi:hypothetical protein
VHVLKLSDVPPDFRSASDCIDVTLFKRITANSSLYDMKEVSGLHFQVQAVIAAQPQTPLILCEAIDLIQRQDLEDVAFICDCATHRSVACAVLLVSLVYQNARIYLTTPRMCNDAYDLGLVR